ncbi:MAG: M14 family zinc carboxypeptidase [Ignavibacterium sp.]|nr:M14 family zinc carboxypeptidase [Ignavibacterium sp.]
MKSIFIFVLFTTLAFPQVNLDEIFKNKSEIYFQFSISSFDELKMLNQIISIDNIKMNTVFAYANKDEFREFLKFNKEFQVLPNPSSLYQADMSNSLEQITQWNVYPTYDAYVTMMYNFQTNYPNICRIVDAGTTVQGRKILFAKISDNVDQREAEPQFMYTSTMHGDETTGYVLMLRLIDSLLSSYGNNSRITNLVNNAEIWINPLANPDGTYRSGNNTVNGATRYNANNIDLNRNFPDPVNGINSNQQIETSRFRTIQEANNFSLIANIHGGAEVINYPWDRWSNVGSGSKIHADQTWYQYISRLYADTAQFYSPSGYMTYLNNGITNGGAWYVITGGRQDYTNWYRHGREVTIEISNTKLPSASLLPSFWEYNKRSFLNYIEHIFYGFKGIVTDTMGNPIRAKVTLIGFDYDSSEVYSDATTGFYNRMVQPGNYRLKFQAQGYYDFITDFYQISNYTSSITVNARMVPIMIPVELSHFSAEINNYQVELKWTTATELNNKGFEIQRCSISKNENCSWESIGFVYGNGTTTEPVDYHFTDKNISNGIYKYRLKQIDFNGEVNFSDEIELNVEIPNLFVLNQNYPNPFGKNISNDNRSTKISWFSSVDDWLTLKVYDVLGREVVTLVNEFKKAGYYEVEFNPDNIQTNILSNNKNLSSGIYFYKIQVGNFSDTKKMIFIR